MNRVPLLPLRNLLFASVAFVLAGASSARAWWDADWTVRKPIVLDASATGTTLPDATGATAVLVRLFDGNFDFSRAKPDGADIRFVAEDDKTVLPHHIERYDSLLNEAFVWVKLPDLKAGAKVSVWLYYSSESPNAVRAEDAKGTYDADTVLVYHFSGDGAPADSSGNANAAETPGTPTAGALIGGGLRFTGNAGITLPASASLKRAAASPLTWSAWVKPTAVADRAVLFSWGDAAGALQIGLARGVPYAEVRTTAGGQRATAPEAAALNVWKHLAVVATETSVTLYVDGAEAARVAAALPALDARAHVGSDADGRNGFVGEFDELALSKVARTAGWVKFAATSQAGSNASTKLVAIGSDETGEAGGGGAASAALEHVMLFGDIAKNMMFDGWIVVFFCCIMAAVCWAVAFKKFFYLNKIEKGSEEFLRQWKLVAADLTQLDHTDAESVKTLGGTSQGTAQKLMQQTPLYHIYHIGSEEIRHRLKSKNGFNGLSARSMEAIKASLDAGRTRELHRLNDGLVYVTISIAGGPYVGLLGTVVGVMITFAVIAKTGQVEVNSIAPGIASALLATVAGLLVAIPALFIYSYLNNRIRDVTSNMQLFIDEFIAKMAEFYPPVDNGTKPPFPFLSSRKEDPAR